jgi:hypothetical protein
MGRDALLIHVIAISFALLCIGLGSYLRLGSVSDGNRETILGTMAMGGIAALVLAFWSLVLACRAIELSQTTNEHAVIVLALIFFEVISPFVLLFLLMFFLARALTRPIGRSPPPPPPAKAVPGGLRRPPTPLSARQ